MERAIVSRQPIYRVDRSELGYELLFRSSDEDRAIFTDGDQATAEVIVNALIGIGLDELVGDRLAFINFDRNLILGNYCEFLPRERVVLEVLETVTPEVVLIDKLKNLHDLRYRIALDDFVCKEVFYPFLEIADFVKFDIQAEEWGSLEQAIATVRKYPVQLIAEKVETAEQFERCKTLGFDYFQGYFFNRPMLIEGRQPPVARSAAINLIIKLNKPDLDIKGLEQVISQDVVLSYKLLRYINSAAYSLRSPVSSIGHAITLLGNEKIRTWASLILFSSFADRLKDITLTGVVRARMCEQLSEKLAIPTPQRTFLVGLLSVLDALMEQPLEPIIKPLPLEPEIVEAVLYQKGTLGAVLRCVTEYEKRNWEAAEAAVGLDQDTIDQAYRQSLQWALSTLSGAFTGQST